MSLTLTAEDAKQSLSGHVAGKGHEIRAKYGPHLGWNELQRILEDRSCVRYPCELVFDAGQLYAGEMAHPVALGDKPEAGFKLFIHPLYMANLESVPAIALYQLVLVNYGEFASTDDAELFGAAALGMSKDEYYHTLCELADNLGELG
jgi:hypothetical protein